jgi:hypothetical protein
LPNQRTCLSLPSGKRVKTKEKLHETNPLKSLKKNDPSLSRSLKGQRMLFSRKLSTPLSLKEKYSWSLRLKKFRCAIEEKYP